MVYKILHILGDSEYGGGSFIVEEICKAANLTNYQASALTTDPLTQEVFSRSGVGVVVLDEPNHGLHWGGYGAAPLFKRIAERIINLDDSFKHYKNETVKSKNVLASKKDGIPPTLSTISTVKPYTDGYVIIPDVRGMSIKKAKKLLIKNRLKPKFSGSGKVVWQFPRPGSQKLPGSSLVMSLKQ